MREIRAERAAAVAAVEVAKTAFDQKRDAVLSAAGVEMSVDSRREVSLHELIRRQRETWANVKLCECKEWADLDAATDRVLAIEKRLRELTESERETKSGADRRPR